MSGIRTGYTQMFIRVFSGYALVPGKRYLPYMPEG